MFKLSLWHLVLALVAFTVTYAKDTTVSKIGILLYPGFEPQDVVGPQEAFLGTVGKKKLKISWLGPSMKPVSNMVENPDFNPMNSSFEIRIVPTHTYDNPPDLDLLIIPGGTATLDPKSAPAVDRVARFIKKTYPKLKYLLTVCTGAGIAAQSGILDGRRATTNKAVWNQTITMGPKVKWVPHARWVVDGNIWTTSGVSAGIDGTLDFIETIWGSEIANSSMVGMEYDRHFNSSWDPFAEYWGVS